MTDESTPKSTPRKQKESPQPLTIKQKLFAEHYAVDMNGAEAAIKAGYSIAGAEVAANRLLNNSNVQRYLAQLTKTQSNKLSLDAETVLKQLMALATVDIGQLYDENGKLKPIHQIPEEVRRCIQSVEIFEQHEGSGRDQVYVGDTKKVKLWDKLKALELLGKYLKLFTEKVEIQANVTLEQLVLASYKLKEKRESEVIDVETSRSATGQIGGDSIAE